MNGMWPLMGKSVKIKKKEWQLENNPITSP